MTDTTLSCMLRRVCSLPPHPCSGHRDAYVSLRITQRYYERVETDEDGNAVSTSPTHGGGRSPSPPTFSPSHDGRHSPALDGSGLTVGTGEFLRIDNHPTDVDRRCSSTMNPKHEKVLKDPSVQLREVVEFIDDVKMQSRMVASSLDPEFYETFVFSNLPIPVRRKSTSALLNCSISGASRRASSRLASITSANGSLQGIADFSNSPSMAESGHNDMLMSQRKVYRLRKVDPTFRLEVEVYDNTMVKGAGEKIATGSVLLDALRQGQRQEVVVPLRMIAAESEGGNKLGDSGTDIQDPSIKLETSAGANTPPPNELPPVFATSSGLPTIEFVMEPHNFGILQEITPEEPVDVSLYKALTEELRDVFSMELIRKIHGIVLAADTNNDEGLGRAEFLQMLQELYFITGTPVPNDALLTNEVEYLYKVFDKDQSDHLDISEICTMFRNSKFAELLKQRWRAPKAGFTASNVIAAANVAGCLWDGESVGVEGYLSRFPVPGSYAGYRRPDGAVNERTKKPIPVQGSTTYVVPNNDHLYEAIGFVPESAATESHTSSSLKRRISDGSSTSTQQHAASTEMVPDGSISPGGTSVGTTSGINNPRKSVVVVDGEVEAKQESIFGETLEYKILEDKELHHCTLNHCHMVRCTIKGGTITGGNLESCRLRDGADVKSSLALRCCRMDHCRIQCSYPANCHINDTVVKECPMVMQSTLKSCEVQMCSIAHCKLSRSTIDPMVRDEGANLLEFCTMQSATFNKTTLETIENVSAERQRKRSVVGELGDEDRDDYLKQIPPPVA